MIQRDGVLERVGRRLELRLEGSSVARAIGLGAVLETLADVLTERARQARAEARRNPLDVVDNHAKGRIYGELATRPVGASVELSTIEW